LENLLKRCHESCAGYWVKGVTGAPTLKKEMPMKKSDNPVSNSHSNTISQGPWKRGPFDFERLDVYQLAREALGKGDALARSLPRGYGKLADQLRRALLSTQLNIAEAASRSGNDRKARFRCARGEASEAAAAVDAIMLLKLAPSDTCQELLNLLGRICAMLTRLAGFYR
jgi:four helix bundle protein